MKKKWICLLTALAVAVGVCAVKPVISGAAPVDPVDLKTKNSLTVNPYDYNNAESRDRWEKTNGMKEAHIQVDLYQIAGAEGVAGYDTYRFTPATGYDSLNIEEYSDLQELKAADWDRLAQEAAKIALADEESAKQCISENMRGTGVTFSDMKPGLYLVVTRGSDLAFGKYTKTVTEEIKEGDSVKEVKKFVTIANSPRYEYSFLPQLIALPTKAPDANGEISTANPGPWLYSMSTNPKVEENDRYGSLEIIKTLSEYESEEGIPEPATFVFEITATLPGADGTPQEVFHAYESITFEAGGTKSVKVDGIPATADVKVVEIYDGASYVISGSAEQLEKIAADEVVDVEFTNVYNGDRKKGYGIKNQFTFDGNTWVHTTPDWNGNTVTPPENEQPTE